MLQVFLAKKQGVFFGSKVLSDHGTSAHATESATDHVGQSYGRLEFLTKTVDSRTI